MHTWQTEAFREFDRPLSEALGDKAGKAFAALGLRTVGDLMRHVPRRYFPGTEVSDLSSLEPGEEVAVVARLRDTSVAGYGAKQRLEARITDGKGVLHLTFFGRESYIRWWEQQLHKGERGIFVGKVGEFRNQLQLTHPTFVMLDERGSVVGKGDKQDLVATVTRSGLVPLYPASAKLPTWTIAGCVELVLESLGSLDDPWPAAVRDRARVPDLAQALTDVHQPIRAEDAAAGKRRLLFDEALATQLAMAKRRQDALAQPAAARPRRRGGLLDAFDARLPFALTAGQQAVGEEIFSDLTLPHPMRRLLQGEVGSGKTLVALRAMLAVVDAGGQAALIAPTEVLAAQHAQTIARMLGDLAEGGMLGAADHATGLTLLTGGLAAPARRQALADIASGAAGLVVGTHALLGDRVSFADLALVVIDEQHRFGVEQRSLLQARAARPPHVLVMTATPIPRSVAMTVFGDLAVSSLTEIPAGRSEVTTTVVDERQHAAWVDRAWARMREEVAAGRQAFVVAPRIGEGTAVERTEDGEGVASLFERLRSGPLHGLRVGMLHGQLPTEQKEAVMREMSEGRLDVLVATTVIEVGVDIPNASMMVIADAERFGISQLHQLRGRIGRGRHPGVCLLLTRAAPDSAARARLDAVAATRDGFALAEVDLEQRREGDVLGTAQAGSRSSLRLLRVTEHADLIRLARDIAEECLRIDPDLATPGFADAVRYTEALADSFEG